MEYIRNVEVEICIDTNKSTNIEVLKMGYSNEDETVEEFIERVNIKLRELLLVSHL